MTDNARTAAAFSQTSCQKNGQPAPQTPKMFKDNMPHLMAKMGMSDKCKRASDLKTRSLTKTDSTKAKVGPFGLFGSGGSRKTNTSTSLDQSFREEGCGSVVMDMKNIMTSVTNINCSLNQSSAESSVATSANAMVSIRVKTPPEFMTRMVDSYDMQAKNMQVIAKTTAIPYKERKAMLKDMLAGMKETQNTIRRMGTLNMQNSVIRAKANTKVKQIASSVQEVTNKVQADYKDIARTTAENTLQRKLGTATMQPSTKKLVNERIEQRNTDIKNDISQIITSTKVNVQSSSKIEIEVPMSVNLQNSEIDANVQIDVVTSALSTNSINLGKDIASQILTEAVSKNKEELEQEGLGPLNEALQEGVKETVKESLKGFDSDWMDMIMMGGALLVLLVVAKGMAGGKSGGSRRFSRSYGGGRRGGKRW